MASRYSAQRRASSSRYAKEHFRSTAADLLRRLGRLRLDRRTLPDPYETMLCEFIALQHKQGWLSDATCRSVRWHITRFLDDLGRRGLVLQTLQPADIDAFYQHMAVRWSRSSLNRSVRFVRAWLGYSETQSHVRPGLAKAMLAPRLYRHEALPMGPTWETVGRMLAATGGDDPASIRDHAILLLLSVYGVRSGEVRHLRLDDIDWSRNRIRFVRSKSGRHEETPLVARVGNAIARYLREARPQSASRVVFLYSRDELQRLLDATPVLQHNRFPGRQTTFRTLLLALYGAGLRPGEGLRLRCRDVDLRERVLTISDTKFFKSRLVPIGNALTDALSAYSVERRHLPMPAGTQSAFFASHTGKPISLGQLGRVFTRLRAHAEVYGPPGARQQPRLHDARHTFAVHRLVAWYREGADVQTCLPLLATYLGHVNLSGTQAYLPMTPELLDEASKRFARYALVEEQENDNA